MSKKKKKQISIGSMLAICLVALTLVSADVFPKRLEFNQAVENSRPQEIIKGDAIFRIDENTNHGILKIKGELAMQIYNGLTQPINTKCKPLAKKKCKRMGLSVVASTQNIKDSVVCEMRFSSTGQLLSLTQEMELYHSFKKNRNWGEYSFDGERMTVSGEAAKSLTSFLNSGQINGETGISNELVFRLLDMASGNWAID